LVICWRVRVLEILLTKTVKPFFGISPINRG
jgi:hypothetical protein